MFFCFVFIKILHRTALSMFQPVICILEVIVLRSDRYSNVATMLYSLGWKTLEERRKHLRLALMYKITNHLVAVPPTHLILADHRTRSNHPLPIKVLYYKTRYDPT